ncbi:MAG TPA: hypothetical protein PLI90_09010 [Rhodocyclaceae bacterium]|nr:hypothetical protein [Anaerolineales bacterium]HQW20791.1 hypothetical protein [Rhodocyclaceae bacterium]
MKASASGNGPATTRAQSRVWDKLIEHKHYIDEHGEDVAEVRNWKWNQTYE